MELLYVWVEEYGNIKRQGFNFSPNYDFEVKEENGEYILVDNFETSGKKKQPENFFGDNISNITAIVGKNGSGKSTLIKFLLKINNYNHYNRSFEEIKMKVVIIFENEEKQMICEKYNFDNLKIIKKLKIKVYENIDKNGGYYREPSIFSFSKKFYFNDLNNLNDVNRSVINPYNYEKKIGENSYSKNKKPAKELLINMSINRIKFFMGLKKIKFFEKNVNLNMLSKIESIIIQTDYFRYSSKWYVSKENINVKKIHSIYRQLEDKLEYEFYNEKKDISKIKYEVIQKDILDYIFSQLIDYVTKMEKIDVIERIGNDKFDIELNQFIETFKRVNNIKDESYFNYFKPFLNATEDENEILFMYKNESYRAFRKDYGIILDKKIIEILAENNNFYDFRLIADQFKINYYPFLSKGEECLLDIFSTFYNNKETIFDYRNILIVLDEGDMHFHPEWQRRYFDIIIGYLSEIYKDKNIQIILTSHSPFVASDLPRENVIMLDTDKDGNCVVKKDKDIKTFGANIFDLYTDAFFVESSFGEFAKGKIKEVVKDLTPNEKGEYGDLTKERIKEIEYILNSIGEPLVKNKLQKMYDGYKEFKIKKLSDDEKNKKIKEIIENSVFKEEDFKIYLEKKND